MNAKIKVSIVEDQSTIRNGLKNLLHEHDEFECVSDFEDAESILKDISFNLPDIVIMDIELPGISGIECIAQLKPLYPDLQFLIFTIYEDNENIFEAIKAGASGYILKSASHQNILNALSDLHLGGSPMNTQIARKLVSAFQNFGNPSPQQPSEYPISPREKEVLALLSKGYLYKEIALQLSISTGTVKQHIHKIYEKLHVQNRTEALNKFFNKSI